jgi:hypothetical protein
MHLPKTQHRPHNLRPGRTTPLRAHTNPTRNRRIAITILPHTHESNITPRRRRTAHRSRLQRIRLVALEPRGIKAYATALGFARTCARRRAVVVTEAQELAVGVARGGGADAVGAGFVGGALVAAGAAVVVGGAQVLAGAVAFGDAVAGADGRGGGYVC